MSAAKRIPDDLIPTRHSLITRLKDWEDQAGWKEFFDTYSELIFKVALKAGLRETEAHEVVQETVITVARNIHSFRTGSEHGSFKAWLLHTTRWRIMDQFRKRAVEPQARADGCETRDDDARTAAIERLPDPNGPAIESVWDHEWEQYRTTAALARLKRSVGAKPFQIFQLLVARQLPPDKVAKILGVSRSLVYVTKHRLGRQFQRELERIERESL